VVIRPRRGPETDMQAFLVSTGIVALAEIGDKTQLLAFMLAARFRRPLPIILGILAATLANHALAGAVGAWITRVLGPDVLRWILGVSFIAMAIWTLIPDRLDAGEARVPRAGVFGTTLVAFFLTEMGDKTQIATVALAAQYQAFSAVVAGTTLGMMIANVPAVLLGQRIAHRMPIRLVHAIAAAIFAIIGIATLWGQSSRFPTSGSAQTHFGVRAISVSEVSFGREIIRSRKLASNDTSDTELPVLL
jgi:putative Ca2+/H+ antiporter (TMEM165/GDT1 family)